MPWLKRTSNWQQKQQPTANTSLASVNGMQTKTLKWRKLPAQSRMPNLLFSAQLQTRAELSVEIFNKYSQDPEAFPWRISTEGETGLYLYDPEDKAQPKQWLPRGGIDPVKQWTSQEQMSQEHCFYAAWCVFLINFLGDQNMVTSAYDESIFTWESQCFS